MNDWPPKATPTPTSERIRTAHTALAAWRLRPLDLLDFSQLLRLNDKLIESRAMSCRNGSLSNSTVRKVPLCPVPRKLALLICSKNESIVEEAANPAEQLKRHTAPKLVAVKQRKERKPTFLDTHGASNSLLSLDLNVSPSTERQQLRATGTDEEDATADARHAVNSVAPTAHKTLAK